MYIFEDQQLKDIFKTQKERLNVVQATTALIIKTGKEQEVESEEFKLLWADGILEDFTSILKVYFEAKDHQTLEEVLKGRPDTKEKLLFRGAGNKLAFAFRQLIDKQLITGQLNDIENWIGKHFQYLDGKKKQRKDYAPAYLNKIISSNAGCQSPILEVKKVKGKFRIESVQRKRKR